MLQLGATLLLAFIRALLRGNVGENPATSPVALTYGVESNKLVTHLAENGCYILTAVYVPSRSADKHHWFRAKDMDTTLFEDGKYITGDNKKALHISSVCLFYNTNSKDDSPREM